MTRPRGLASREFPPLLFFLFLFLLATPSAFALESTFDFYPKTARSCLSQAAALSACSGDTAREINTCLCSNGGQFIETTIRCLAKQDNDDLGDVHTTMDGACNASGTPLTWKWSDWVDAARSAKHSSSSFSSSSTTSTETSSTTSTESTSTTLTTTTSSSTSSDSSSSPSSSPLSSSPSGATATATDSSTSSPSPGAGQKDGDGSSSSSSSSSNLSTTATIGLATGVSIAGVAAIAGLAFFLVRKRKRASRLPMSYSMLNPEKYNGAGGAATTYPSPHDSPPSNLSGGGGGGAGFGSEANETPLYTVPAYASKSQSMQSYTALSSTSPGPGLEQPKQQHNFLSGWEPPSQAHYSGPYAPSQTGPVELPPQMQPLSGIFELDSHGVVAPPRPAQPALQPIAERPQDSRVYKPYMPT